MAPVVIFQLIGLAAVLALSLAAFAAWAWDESATWRARRRQDRRRSARLRRRKV